MARVRDISLLMLLLGLILVGCYRERASGPQIPRMTKEELRPLMGQPEVILIDVREPDDWNKSKEKIRGAVREDPEKEVALWAGRYSKDKTLVFYCY